MVAQFCPTIEEVQFIIDKYKNDEEIFSEQTESNKKVGL